MSSNNPDPEFVLDDGDIEYRITTVVIGAGIPCARILDLCFAADGLQIHVFGDDLDCASHGALPVDGTRRAVEYLDPVDIEHGIHRRPVLVVGHPVG